MCNSLSKSPFSFFLLLFISFWAKAQAPVGYYDAAQGLEGQALKEALYQIIKGHKTYPYTSSATDTWDII